MSGRSLGEMSRVIRAGGTYILKGKSHSPREARWKTLGFAAAALFSIVLYQWIYVESKILGASEKSVANPKNALADYEAMEAQDLTIDPEDPILGSADSPVRLVVFSNFDCPGCRSFSGDLYSLAVRFNGRIGIVFKYYAGTSCRPVPGNDRPPLACMAAWSAEAARRQGKFWQYHDALFALPAIEDEATLSRIARDLNLDIDRFEKDRGSFDVRKRVWANIEEGYNRAIDATPAVFLRGKRVFDFRIETLTLLIENELAKK